MILRCPTCGALVEPLDETCPICEHPVPEEARVPVVDPPVATTPAPRIGRRPGRTAVRVVAVLGWVVVVVLLAAVLRAWT